MVDGAVDGKAGGNGALRPHDVATLSAVLRVCDLETVLLDGNGPRAALHSRVHDDALLLAAHGGFHFRGRFTLPQDWCLLGFIHATDETQSWCHGIPLSAGMVVTVLPESISEFTLSAGTRLSLLLAPMQRVKRTLTALSLRSTLPSGQALSLFNPDVTRAGSGLVERYAALHATLADPGAALAADTVDALLHDHIQALLGAGNEDRPSNSRARRAHYLIAQRAENFMRLNLRHYLYMHDICDATGVSERALRYAFEDLFGTSPNRYLSLLRLCAACRGLSMADSSRKSVKAVALSCGLWDLSRFADNYRRVFGELPRDTLMRAPAQIGNPA